MSEGKDLEIEGLISEAGSVETVPLPNTTKMDKSFEDVIEHAINTIFDGDMSRDDAYHYLNGYLEEELREFAGRWGRKVENAFLEWLLGVD